MRFRGKNDDPKSLGCRITCGPGEPGSPGSPSLPSSPSLPGAPLLPEGPLWPHWPCQGKIKSAESNNNPKFPRYLETAWAPRKQKEKKSIPYRTSAKWQRNDRYSSLCSKFFTHTLCQSACRHDRRHLCCCRHVLNYVMKWCSTCRNRHWP